MAMAQRYVRIQNPEGQIYYGIVLVNRSVQALDAPPWLKGKPTDLEFPPDEYQLLAPCAPSKIIAVGKNYAEHAAEMGGVVPKEPLLFLKPPTTVIATQTPILYPSQSQKVDYEGELAIVMGKKCADCSAAQALDNIWGYTIANDVTARDLQRKDSQWTRGKGFDTFCPLGPWIVREISSSALLQTFLNDDEQPVQSASIDRMVFSPEAIVSYISQVMTLLPGDVILTGTPEGVGPVQPGDRVRIEIEGIGCLENSIAAKTPKTLQN